MRPKKTNNRDFHFFFFLKIWGIYNVYIFPPRLTPASVCNPVKLPGLSFQISPTKTHPHGAFSFFFFFWLKRSRPCHAQSRVRYSRVLLTAPFRKWLLLENRFLNFRTILPFFFDLTISFSDFVIFWPIFLALPPKFRRND